MTLRGFKVRLFLFFGLRLSHEAEKVQMAEEEVCVGKLNPSIKCRRVYLNAASMKRAFASGCRQVPLRVVRLLLRVDAEECGETGLKTWRSL